MPVSREGPAITGGWIRTLPALFAIAALTGCSAPFADLQSADVTDNGQVQITPSFTRVSVATNDTLLEPPGLGHYWLVNRPKSAAAQDEFTLQIARGVSSHAEVRARFTFIEPQGITVISIGPKLALVPGRLAIGVPFGFSLFSPLLMAQAQPTLFLTIPVYRGAEVNLSGKAILPVNSNGDVGLAANLGLGLSTNPDQWALRPEIGVLKYPGYDGVVKQASLGLSIYSGPPSVRAQP